MKLVLLAALFILTVTCAAAQPLWRGRATETAIGLRFDKAKFSDRNAGISGVIVTPFAEISLQPATTLIVSIPVMTGSVSTSFYTDDEITVGNPYVGVEFGAPASVVYGEFGVRLPLATDQKRYASSIATLTDFENFEAYVPHVFQVSAAADFEAEVSPSLWILGKVGPSADVLTTGGTSTSVYGNYGVTGQVRLEALSMGVGYAARTLLSESTPGDRTIDYVSAVGSYRITKVEIGMQVRYTMDESLRRELDLAYALSLRTTL